MKASKPSLRRRDPPAPRNSQAVPSRVVVTGVGQVSSLGTDLSTFRDRIRDGRPGVARLEGFSAPGLPDPIGAAIPGFDPRAWLPGRALSGIPRVALYAQAAAVQAIRQENWKEPEIRVRFALHTGAASPSENPLAR